MRPVVITSRPREAYEIVQFLRARGWVYHPFDHMRWHYGPIVAMSAADAMSLAFAEVRIEFR